MSDCIFCQIVKKQISSEIVFEDDLTIAFMDAFPVAEGHILLIPKEHVENLHSIPDKTIAVILNNLKTIAKASKLTNYNILQNNGPKAGQTVFHAHFHLIPRDVENIGFTFSFKALNNVDQKSAAQKIRNSLV